MYVLKSEGADYGSVFRIVKRNTHQAAMESSHELSEKLGSLIRSERKMTNEILKLINQALDQRSYLDLGFPSMFEWLTRGFGYSNAAAYRRIQAARLLKSLPENSKKELERKIEKGSMNLTTLSKIQTTIKAQEKASGVQVKPELKEEILKRIEVSTGVFSGNPSVRSTSVRASSEDETQRLLFEILPEAQSEILQDRRKVISEDLIRHSITFTREMEENLTRAKEVLSHICPGGTDQEVISYALRFLLDRKLSLTRAASAAEAMRVTGISQIPSCAYQDPQTGRICGSRFQVQMDHIIPKARGGSDHPSNLRPLCRQHNLHAAERVFGKSHMSQFLKESGEPLCRKY